MRAFFRFVPERAGGRVCRRAVRSPENGRLAPKMPIVGVGNWIRGLFSSNRGDDEAAEREEYGVPDRGDHDGERASLGTFADAEATEAAAGELDEFKAPRDPAP
jgi:hypothetical protein